MAPPRRDHRAEADAVGNSAGIGPALMDAVLGPEAAAQAAERGRLDHAQRLRKDRQDRLAHVVVIIILACVAVLAVAATYATVAGLV